MIDKLLIASANLHKVAEIKEIFAKANIEIPLVTLNDLQNPPEVAEPGATFSENALIKARALCAFSGLTTIADDSGLSVVALDGQPGVLSARWAGSHGDDLANLNLVLEQMKEVEHPLRTASFICSAAIKLPDGREFSVQGELKGHLTKEPKGDNGFGYDPIFIPDGFNQTTAEMTFEQKNLISHRYKAFIKLAAILRSLGK